MTGAGPAGPRCTKDWPMMKSAPLDDSDPVDSDR